MRIKYRNKILQPNHSRYCIDCDIHDINHRTCSALCYETNVFGGFNISNDCEVLEL